jgi:hypothetical protein
VRGQIDDALVLKVVERALELVLEAADGLLLLHVRVRALLGGRAEVERVERGGQLLLLRGAGSVDGGGVVDDGQPAVRRRRVVLEVLELHACGGKQMGIDAEDD